MKKYLFLIIIMLIININFVYAKEKVKFSSCIDGDTIKVLLNNKAVTVRLLAVDTPELAKNDVEAEYYAEEAQKFTCNKIKYAKKIELEYDPKSDKYDKYDRILAWVYVDGKLLEDDLVSEGYAKVAYLYDDYKYADTLKEKQELASANKIGIWNDDARKKYENNDSSSLEEITDEYTNKEVGIIVAILLIIAFVTDKIIRLKKK